MEALGDESSNLNLSVGQVAANLVVVPTNQMPGISVYNDQGWVNVAMDIVGYYRYATIDDFYGGSPLRVLDSRPGSTTFDGLQTGTGKIGPGGVTSVNFDRGFLASWVSPGDVVVLNVTSVWPSAATFLTVYPGGTTRPLTSSLNSPAAANVPNLVFARVGADLTVSIYNDKGYDDVVVDLLGLVPSWGTMTSLASPKRFLETRPGQRTDDMIAAGGGKIGPHGVRSVQIAGRLGVPANAVAVAINVTAVAPSSFTFLAAYPGGMTRPTVSTVNLNVGEVRPNAAVVPLGPTGTIDVYNELGFVDVVIDVTAWYDRSKPSIFGSVTDSAGAPIPGAVVTATSTEYPYSAAAPGTVTATANAAGAYQILASNPNLWVVCSDGPTHNYVLGCFGVDGTTTPGDVVGVPSYARTGPVNLTLHK